MQSHELPVARTFFLVFDRGDEVIATVRAFERAVIAWWSWTTKEYERREVEEQLEVLALTGNITMENGRVKVHAHVSLGRRDGIASGVRDDVSR